MSTIIAILSGMFVLTICVLFHEFGHYVAAKKSGMIVDEFGYGIGKTMLQKKRGDTTYKLNLIPVLGYVKIHGMDSDYDNPRGYYQQNAFKRFVAVAAGPAFNFLLAFLIYATVFTFVGNPNVPGTSIGAIASGSPAASAGLMKNDAVLSISGNSVKKWDDITNAIQASNGKTVSVTVKRQDATLVIPITPSYSNTETRYIIGVTSAPQKYAFPQSILEGAKYTVQVVGRSFASLPLIFTKSGAQSVTGPIGIVRMSGEAARFGFIDLFLFAAVISIALGMTQVLPFPPFDGGWMLIVILEMIFRKRIPAERTSKVMTVAMLVALALMAIITLKDIITPFFS